MLIVLFFIKHKSQMNIIQLAHAICNYQEFSFFNANIQSHANAWSRRSMGPIDESQERYTLDCYFRQNWRDERLVSCDWLIADNTRL